MYDNYNDKRIVIIFDVQGSISSPRLMTSPAFTRPTRALMRETDIDVFIKLLCVAIILKTAARGWGRRARLC